MTNRKVENLKKLGLTDDEIADVLETDKRIDQGEKLFELDPELEKGAKKARQADRKKSDTPVKRERKVDDDKRTLLNLLFSAVLPHCETYEITNGEREFLFTYNGRKFKVTLSAPRS